MSNRLKAYARLTFASLDLATQPTNITEQATTSLPDSECRPGYPNIRTHKPVLFDIAERSKGSNDRQSGCIDLWTSFVPTRQATVSLYHTDCFGATETVSLPTPSRISGLPRLGLGGARIDQMDRTSDKVAAPSTDVLGSASEKATNTCTFLHRPGCHRPRAP